METIQKSGNREPETGLSPRFGHVSALDGLRGLAVALVVVYHFAPEVLPAGFIGVDIFFVLSGFLITSLALGEHRTSSKVSSSGFYMRRARRLLPAAIVTVVVAIALAAVLQPDSTRAANRGMGIASLLYVANWWMIDQQNSYQATFGTESPLSHFWSLAVEEQFYVFFPLLLLVVIVVVARRGGRTASLAKWLLALSVLGALASATLMSVMYSADTDPSRVYLGTATRVHELFVGVAGACVWWLWSAALRERASLRILTAVAAVSAIFLGLVSVFSSFRASWLYHFGFLTIAVAALAIVLAAVAKSSVISKVFELRVLCVLGLVSYSVYLWHWPVRVFVNSSNTPFDGLSLFCVRIVLTAVAASLSFFLIERPFRAVKSAKRVALLSVAGMAVALCAVWVISRPVPAASTEFSTSEAPAAAEELQSPLKILWLGDSVAWVLGGGRLEFPHPTGYDSPFDSGRVLIWNKAEFGCPLVAYPQRSFGVIKENNGWCVDHEGQWPPLIAQFLPDVVAWSGILLDTYDYKVDGKWIAFGSPEWDALYLSILDRARVIATSSGATFMVIGQADPLADPAQSGDGQETLLPENLWRFVHVRELQRKFAEQHSNDTVFVDMQPIVCPNDSCKDLVIDPKGTRPDGVHFTKEAVLAMAPEMQRALEKAMGR